MSFNGQKASAIKSQEVYDFIESAVNHKYLYSDWVVKEYLNTYFEWVQKSKLNEFHGLENFNSLSFVHGTSQAFDFFYREHQDRRFRCFKGDFVYHKVSWRGFNWKYIEDDYIDFNDAVVISLPFSDTGGTHEGMNEILDICDKHDIPVFIDAAYYSIARNLEIDLTRPCIHTVAFSMSKAFHGTHRLRIGMRCKKENIDDPVDFFNEIEMVSKISAGVGLEICDNFTTDYNQDKYREKQISLCEDLNIQPSDSVVFGIADKTHPDFGGYDRGTDSRRVCISNLLSDRTGADNE